ncbi:MAG: hypothetical protein NTX25_12670, partial [Proteobacteria bacterium]|nr:hypothetical protein [Pseudomonadota bacterium]
FYAGVSYARRIVKVKSQVRSALIFEDGASQIMSNTEFSVDLKSRTEQELLRSVIGQRWSNKHIFWGWILGAVKPIRSQSNIISTVRILNPMASDSADAAASNIEEARQSQENLVKSKAQKQLRILEQKTLPVVGLELGFRF